MCIFVLLISTTEAVTNNLLLLLRLTLEKPEGNSRMDNPETMTTLGTQDTKRRQNNIINHNTKR